MKDNILIKISELRYAVGSLMESKKWWNTQFFDSNSKDFLGYIFPKSINQKMDFYQDPIRHLVDAEVGANYYHLFRLPIHVEEKLFKMAKIQQNDQALLGGNSLEFLKKITDDLFIEQHQGPINVGSSEHIDSDIIRTLAAHYLSAFENDYKVHPYLN